jgi:hypothetical protein
MPNVQQPQGIRLHEGVELYRTHALRGTVKGRERFFYDTLARVWSSGDPRRFRALR